VYAVPFVRLVIAADVEPLGTVTRVDDGVEDTVKEVGAGVATGASHTTEACPSPAVAETLATGNALEYPIVIVVVVDVTVQWGSSRTI